MDWQESDTYFLLLRRILTIIIGLELIRFIQTFSIETLIEILIFLLARKVLIMEIDENYAGLLVVVSSLCLLIGMQAFVRRYAHTKLINPH